jgi:hypothetical protein
MLISMKQILIVATLFQAVIAIAQTSTINKGDAYFLEGTKNIFDSNNSVAPLFFEKAFDEYQKDKNYRKMNECLVALATIEFSNGDYTKALKKLQNARSRHLKYCVNDPEGLKLLDHSIELCIEEMKASTEN